MPKRAKKSGALVWDDVTTEQTARYSGAGGVVKRTRAKRARTQSRVEPAYVRPATLFGMHQPLVSSVPFNVHTLKLPPISSQGVSMSMPPPHAASVVQKMLGPATLPEVVNSRIRACLSRTHLEIDVRRHAQFYGAFMELANMAGWRSRSLSSVHDYASTRSTTHRHRSREQDLIANPEQRCFVVYIAEGFDSRANAVFMDKHEALLPTASVPSMRDPTKSRARLMDVVMNTLRKVHTTISSMSEIPDAIRDAIVVRGSLAAIFPAMPASTSRTDHSGPPLWIGSAVVSSRYAAHAEVDARISRGSFMLDEQYARMRDYVDRSDVVALPIPAVLVADLSVLKLTAQKLNAIVAARSYVRELIPAALEAAGVEHECYVKELSAPYATTVQPSEGPPDHTEDHAMDEVDEIAAPVKTKVAGSPHVLDLADLCARVTSSSAGVIVEEVGRGAALVVTDGDVRITETCPSGWGGFGDEPDAMTNTARVASKSLSTLDEAESLQIFSDIPRASANTSTAELYNLCTLDAVHDLASVTADESANFYANTPRDEVTLLAAYRRGAAVFSVIAAFVDSGAVNPEACRAHKSVTAAYRHVFNRVRGSCSTDHACNPMCCAMCAMLECILCYTANAVCTISSPCFSAASGPEGERVATVDVPTAMAQALNFFDDIETALAAHLAASPSWRFVDFTVVPVVRSDVLCAHGVTRSELLFGQTPGVSGELELLSTARVINDMLAVSGETRVYAVADVLSGVLHVSDARIVEALQVGFVPTCPSPFQRCASTSAGVSESISEVVGCIVSTSTVDKPLRSFYRVGDGDEDNKVIMDALNVPMEARIYPLRYDAFITWPLIARALESGCCMQTYFGLRWLSKHLALCRYPITRSAPGVFTAMDKRILRVPAILNRLCMVAVLEDINSIEASVVEPFRRAVNEATSQAGAPATRVGLPRLGANSIQVTLWTAIHSTMRYVYLQVGVVKFVLNALENTAYTEAMLNFEQLRSVCKLFVRDEYRFNRITHPHVQDVEYYCIDTAANTSRERELLAAACDTPLPMLFFEFACMCHRVGVGVYDARAIAYGVYVSARRHALSNGITSVFAHNAAWFARKAAHMVDASALQTSMVDDIDAYDDAMRQCDTLCVEQNALLPGLRRAIMATEVAARFSPNITIDNDSSHSGMVFRGHLSPAIMRSIARPARVDDLISSAVPVPVARYSTDSEAPIVHRQTFPVWRSHLATTGVQDWNLPAISPRKGYRPLAGAHPDFLKCVVGGPLLIRTRSAATA